MSWEADAIYGGAEIGKPGKIKDAILAEDKDGNPTLSLYIEVGHKAANSRNPEEPGGEEIGLAEEEIRLFLGLEGDEKSEKRRSIALDQLSVIVGKQLEDKPETLLVFLPEIKDSLIPVLLEKSVWLKANEVPTSGKVYLNLWVPRPKPQQVSMKDLRAKILKRQKELKGE